MNHYVCFFCGNDWACYDDSVIDVCPFCGHSDFTECAFVE